MAEKTRLERGSHSGDSRVSQDDFLVTPNASTLSGESCTSSNDNMTTGYTLDEKYVQAIHDNKKPLRPSMQPTSNEQRKCDDDKEYARRTNNMLNIQSAIAAQDAFLRVGYDMRPYYGWLPGIPPLRFPAAFIYPQTFLEFASQNVDKEARKGQGSENRFHPSDKWEESDEVARRDEDDDMFAGHDGGITAQRNNTEKPYSSNRFQGDARSDDDDEGLELDEYDSNSISETSSLSPVTPPVPQGGQPYGRVANVSVIQETNCKVQKPKDARGDVQSECNEMNAERKGTTKRGRASTRQIEKTDQYWDRRKKNNVSAKKSRDARRQREMITNQRSSKMEAENLRLRAEVATLKEENERLKKELGNVM